MNKTIVKTVTLLLMMTLMGITAQKTAAQKKEVPSYLKGYEELYAKNPHAAAIQWHKDAKFGLFIHYCLGSMIPVTAEMAKEAKAQSKEAWQELRSSHIQTVGKYFNEFTAENFDANFITELALSAGMKYINFTTRHIGELNMWDTKTSDYNSMKAPARRDLVRELAEQCRKKGLGLFLYVPPDVAKTEPEERYQKNRAILTELLSNYGDIAGIWFDGNTYYYADPEAYTRTRELYALIKKLQPQCLVSFKQGMGGEDFSAPEFMMYGMKGTLAQAAWAANKDKWGDICANMQYDPDSWLYMDGCKHFTADQLWELLSKAFGQNANLTINIAPLPDGTVHPDDVKTFVEIGNRIRKEGYPPPYITENKKEYMPIEWREKNKP